jgi:hypothetical protein
MKKQHKNIIRFELPQRMPDMKYIPKTLSDKTVLKHHAKKDIYCVAILVWLFGERFQSFGVSEVIENKNFEGREIEYFLS